jgi:hypothetical protein
MQFGFGQALTVVGVLFLFLLRLSADELHEDFSADLRARRWSNFGDTNLFRWDAAGEALEVTWDSAQPNSYLELPLGTILTRRDDFEVQLDLELRDIAVGVAAGRPGTFQVAFGFINQTSAHATNFIRGTGRNSPNLVEFNFFPDAGYGPTIWPAVFPTNGVMNYGGASDISIFELPIGEKLRVLLKYASTNQAASVAITTNGVLVGKVTTAALMPGFTEFLVDTFAISSYSDAGQGPFMPGSIFARGVIDNVVITTPPPPVRDFVGKIVDEKWEGTFRSRTNWMYGLEASEDLAHWKLAGSVSAGTDDLMSVSGSEPAADKKEFYRISAAPRLGTP